IAGATAVGGLDATAHASAVGVRQLAVAAGSSGHATASVFNDSAKALINASANANASAFVATATANAVGVGQVVAAPGGFGLAKVVNDGVIDALANAHASGFFASAVAQATGVGQVVAAGLTGTAFVSNAGQRASIVANAHASAVATL